MLFGTTARKTNKQKSKLNFERHFETKIQHLIKQTTSDVTQQQQQQH